MITSNLHRRVLIALFFVFSFPVSVGALSMSMYSFIDVSPTAWYAPFVRDATALGIVSGYKDVYGNPTGMFGPEKPVTIAEALKISLESAGYDSSLGHGYGHWAANYLSIATGENFAITQQYSLNLDAPATRAEVASIVNDAFRVQIPEPGPVPFSDVNLSTQYAPSIQSLAADGILSGDTDATGQQTGYFRPYDRVNRAEVVKITMGARALYGEPGRRSSSSSSYSSLSRSSSSSISRCTIPECGYAPGMPNWLCSDGSLGGPSCERLPTGRCGWLIRDCSSSRSSSSSSSSSRVGITYNVLYTPVGFNPPVIRIRVGDAIAFKNERAGVGMWVASNPHPVHNEYPIFDARAASGTGQTFTFTFSVNGVFGYHNHLKPEQQGVVIVEQ